MDRDFVPTLRAEDLTALETSLNLPQPSPCHSRRHIKGQPRGLPVQITVSMRELSLL